MFLLAFYTKFLLLHFYPSISSNQLPSEELISFCCSSHLITAQHANLSILITLLRLVSLSFLSNAMISPSYAILPLHISCLLAQMYQLKSYYNLTAVGRSLMHASHHTTRTTEANHSVDNCPPPVVHSFAVVALRAISGAIELWLVFSEDWFYVHLANKPLVLHNYFGPCRAESNHGFSFPQLI